MESKQSESLVQLDLCLFTRMWVEKGLNPQLAVVVVASWTAHWRPADSVLAEATVTNHPLIHTRRMPWTVPQNRETRKQNWTWVWQQHHALQRKPWELLSKTHDKCRCNCMQMWCQQEVHPKKIESILLSNIFFKTSFCTEIMTIWSFVKQESVVLNSSSKQRHACADHKLPWSVHLHHSCSCSVNLKSHIMGSEQPKLSWLPKKKSCDLWVASVTHQEQTQDCSRVLLNVTLLMGQCGKKWQGHCHEID